MAKVTPQLIKELRERTQAGMTDCKNALVEADADIEKAVEIILKKGLAKIAKRAGAVATEGEIRTHLSDDGRVGVMVEINVQTDFASRSEGFKGFADKVMQLAPTVPTLEALMQSPLPGSTKTVEAERDALIATIGEKIEVRRIARVELSGPAGKVHSYVHMNGRIGVLLEVLAENDAVAQHPAFVKFIDDTAMQVAAMTPLYVDRTQVPAGDTAKQREIFEAQLKEENKPQAAIPKIVEGKVGKWYTDICLVDQQSVIETQKSIDQVRAEAAQEAGGTIKIVSFVRYQLGEGLTKKQDDFVQEAQRMADQG